MPLDPTLCVLSPKPCIVFIGMNTRRKATRRLDEDIFSAGVPTCGNQDPPFEEVAHDDQAPANPPDIMDRDISASFIKMSQVIATQAQAITTQARHITAQANREVVSQRNHHVRTMASHLRDFTRMNPLTFYGSKMEEDPKNS